MKYATQIKALFIDYLLRNRSTHSLIVSELPFLGGRRFADLLTISKNKIHVFEIKGPRDSLVRLRGQQDDFTSVADYFWIVTSENSLAGVLKIANINTGIILLKDGGEFLVYRKAKLIRSLDKYNVLTFFSRDDLYGFIKKEKCFNSLQIHELRKLISKLEIKDIVYKKKLKNLFIKKYMPRFEIFLNERGDRTSTDDLQVLQSNYHLIINLKD